MKSYSGSIPRQAQLLLQKLIKSEIESLLILRRSGKEVFLVKNWKSELKSTSKPCLGKNNYPIFTWGRRIFEWISIFAFSKRIFWIYRKLLWLCWWNCWFHRIQSSNFSFQKNAWKSVPTRFEIYFLQSQSHHNLVYILWKFRKSPHRYLHHQQSFWDCSASLVVQTKIISLFLQKYLKFETPEQIFILSENRFSIHQNRSFYFSVFRGSLWCQCVVNCGEF